MGKVLPHSFIGAAAHYALSYWNNTIIVGSENGDIIILDAITGSQMAVLSGHT
jgi:hypothetical protein